MAVVVAARTGAQFRGDDGEERVVVQISRGSWPKETELRLVETRSLPSDPERSLDEEELYVTPDGLRLWARRSPPESGVIRRPFPQARER